MIDKKHIILLLEESTQGIITHYLTRNDTQVNLTEYHPNWHQKHKKYSSINKFQVYLTENNEPVKVFWIFFSKIEKNTILREIAYENCSKRCLDYWFHSLYCNHKNVIMNTNCLSCDLNCCAVINYSLPQTQ